MRVSLISLVVLGVCVSAPSVLADSCPDTHAWTGKVRNHSYGFTFVVPRGLKAYWNSARCIDDPKEGCTCMSDHGRIMALGRRARGVDRQMEMYADFGAEFETGTLSEVVRSFRQHGEGEGASHWRVTRSAPYRLGRLHGRWLEARFLDARTGTPMVRQEVVAYREKKSSLLYQPYLLTPAKDLATDGPKFRAMLRSFRVTRGEY